VRYSISNRFTLPTCSPRQTSIQREALSPGVLVITPCWPCPLLALGKPSGQLPCVAPRRVHLPIDRLNCCHELRTPLAAILGYAELIQEGFYEPQGPKSLDALTRIRSNGKHLLGLINTVLDIAKIDSGQFTLNMAEYAIESVIETVRAATESLAQNKKLTLTTSVDKSLPVGLGDEQRLTQVLLNLVGNAIKFTDAGEIRVTAKLVNGNFAVSVADTGPGIPEEHQARIFEQFHQVDSSSTRAKGGTGLGLAIAKEIVEMHGGRIWVVSTPGKGSTFQMELPTRAVFRKPA
jgi:signal transduction histidine kinase